jgi:hypothetical protein
MVTVLEGVLPRSNVLLCDFFWKKVLNAKDIHKEIFLVYCEKYVQRKTLHNLVDKFSQGRSKVAYYA